MSSVVAGAGGDGERSRFVLVGGSGFLGAVTAERLGRAGAEVAIVDRRPPAAPLGRLGIRWIECDLLVDDVALPEGHVVVVVGNGNPRPRWPWTLPLDIALTTARLTDALAGRRVTLVSSVEIYGDAAPPLSEETEPCLPVGHAELAGWCRDARSAAGGCCAPWRVAALCRRLTDSDPSGRWVYGLSKLAQETLVRAAVPEAACTVLRVANTIGLGQERVVSRLARNALAGRPLSVTATAVRSFVAVEDIADVLLADPGPGVFNLGGPPVAIPEVAELIVRMCASSSSVDLVPGPRSDTCGVVDTARLHRTGIRLRPLEESIASFVERLARSEEPRFRPPLPVVIPPRAVRPDVVADRQQEALWSGRVKHGNRWTHQLREQLHAALELEADAELALTASGTEALRVAVLATVGPARFGEVAAVPSFTYPATTAVLRQLGYTLRFVDVDEWTWTLDPAALASLLSEEPVAVTVCVDTFGNPCDYDALVRVCGHTGVPLVADSAAALGSLYRGRPVGTQADAHAFSMSFAKVVSAAGAGGAVVLRGERAAGLGGSSARTPMDELHAIAALDQLAVIEELVERRQRVAEAYERAAASCAGRVVPQRVAEHTRHSYVHWVARVPGRERVAHELSRLGVQTRDYFRALHLQETGAERKVQLPATERLDSEAIALPMSSELTGEEAETVAVALEEALARATAVDEQLLSEVGQRRLLRQPALE